MGTEYIIKWINDARGAVKAGATATQLEAKINKLQASLNKTGVASKKTTQAQEKMGKSFLGLKFKVNDFTKALARVAVVAPVWMIFRSIITGLTSAFTEAGQAFRDFQKEMGRVATVTLAVGATAQEFENLKRAVISFAASSSASMKDTATAMYQLGTAGLSAKEALKGFEHIMNLSIATLTDVDTTGRLVAGAYNLFGKEMDNNLSLAEKFKHVADVLATTFKTQQVELSEIATAFGFAANAANSINFEFEDLTATIGFLNTGLLRGSKAGTSLTNALIKMSKNASLLEEITGKAFDPRKPIEFVETMKLLNQKFGEGKLALLDDANLIKAFGIRGVRAVKSILQRWDEWEAALKRNRGNVENAAKDMRIAFEDNVAMQIEEMTQKFGEFTSALATKTDGLVTPALKKMNIGMTALIDLINKPDVEKFAGILGLAFTKNTDKIKDFIGYVNEAKEASDKMSEKWGGFATLLKDPDIATYVGILGLAFTGNIDKIQDYIKHINKVKEAFKKLKEETDVPEVDIRTSEEFSRDIKLLKAGGATNLEIAKQTLYYYEIEKDMGEKTNKVLNARNKLEVERLKILVKQSKEFRKVVSTSMREAFDADRDFFAAFEDNFKESLRSAILDTVSESMTNALMNITKMDVMFGKALEGTKIQRAIIVGADYHAKTIKMAIMEGAQASGGAGGLGTTGLVSQLIPKYPVSKGGMVPIAPPDYYKTQGAETPKKGFLEGMGGWQGLLGMGMMGAMLAQGGKGRTSISQAYGTAPGGTTSKASTRSTTVAKITNIQVSPVFNLDGASINDAETIKESAAKMAELFKIELMEILSNENVATGNV